MIDKYNLKLIWKTISKGLAVRFATMILFSHVLKYLLLKSSAWVRLKFHQSEDKNIFYYKKQDGNQTSFSDNKGGALHPFLK